jgi:GT2 family glycosyltransferase
MSNKNHLELSISIVSFNTKKLLQQCLHSIYKNTKGITFEIFVIDNASTDGSPQMIEKEFPHVHLIRNDKNLFFTKANNQALLKTKGKYIVILNSDTQVHKETLSKALKFLKNNPRIGALGIKHLYFDGALEPSCQQFTNPFHEFLHSNIIAAKFPKPQVLKKIFYADWDRKSSRYVDAVSDACLIAPRHVLEKIGWYDERFLLFFTENDLCLRIQKAGYKMYYLAESSITHIRNQSVKQLKSKKAYQIYEHDMLAYYKKYFGLPGWLFLFLTSQTNRLYYLLEPIISHLRKLSEEYSFSNE